MPSSKKLSAAILSTNRQNTIIGERPNGWIPPVEFAIEDVLPEIESFEKLMKPATSQEIGVCLFEMCKMVQGTGKIQEGINIWFQELANVPLDILTKACRKWYLENKFEPVISELLPLIKPELDRRIMILARLKTLRNVSQKPAPNAQITLEWVKRVREKDAY